MARYQRGGQRSFEPPEPKPYDMVSLPRQVSRGKPTGHDQYHVGESYVTGQIDGTIEALSPIHVGSGIVDVGQDAPLIKTAVRTGGRTVIPGSSLKGAIRSIVEAISASCVCKSRLRFDQMPRGSSECRRKESLCIACRMFGAMGFQGNVSIHDAPQTEGQVVTKRIPELYAPSTRRRAYFDDSRRVAGRKFYMHGNVAAGNTPVEACEVGSKFRLSIQGDNLTKAEWGLLFIALGQHPDYPFKLKIGGAKPACFGSIDITIDEARTDADARERYLDWQSVSRTVINGDLLNRWQDGCVQVAMTTLVQQPQLVKLAEILRYPHERNCPSGMY